MAAMSLKQRIAHYRQNPIARLALMIIGVFFLLITAIIGPLPGPGGVFTFAIGLGLVLQNSRWARRRYVHFKRGQPKIGVWTDWGLRRLSAKRRGERDQERAKAEGKPIDPYSPLGLRDWWKWMRAHQNDPDPQ